MGFRRRRESFPLIHGVNTLVLVWDSPEVLRALNTRPPEKGMSKMGPAGQTIINPWPKSLMTKMLQMYSSMAAWGRWWSAAFWNQSVQVLMYRPLEESERVGESFSTHKCHVEPADFSGIYPLKTLIKSEGSLVRLRLTHDDSRPYRFERLCNFSSANALAERGSALRSPKPSM